ncbi:autophagy-related protein 13-like [Tachypleus tridentatus]|uniref:autophagy-related protein 13-like n=1 Tax=Tachypleus tridentatus TaxID=6853 RepID=UPI003FD48F60
MMSVKVKLTSQDRRDLEKFMKFLAIKAVQVIVQSRLGERIKTRSKPYSCGAEWFNVAIKDLPEIQAEAKKDLANQLPMFRTNMCTEISLKTVDGDTLVLETWSLGMTEKCDPMARVIPTVYSRMSLLLKSLIAVSRVTPAYKLSSRQGPDSFVICYRVYMGDIQNNQLGEGYQEARIGQVSTPVGTIVLTVAYRTKLTITPQQSARQSPIMLKSDYFKPDHSPKHQQHAQGINGGVFVDLNQLEQPPVFKENRLVDPTAVPKENPIVEQPVHINNKNNVNTAHLNGTDNRENSEVECVNQCDKLPQKSEPTNINGSFTSDVNLGNRKMGAFAPAKVPDSSFPNLLPDTPFQSLLKHDKGDSPVSMKQRHQENSRYPETKGNGDSNANKNEVATNKCSTTYNADKSLDMNQNTVDLAAQKSVWTEASVCDDFVLVELKPPFAENDGNGDLGTFFRECRTAPPLASFNHQPTLEEQMSEISHQLAALETSLHDFDDFVNSICHTDSPIS